MVIISDVDRLAEFFVGRGATVVEAAAPAMRIRAQLALGIPADAADVHGRARVRLEESARFAASVEGTGAQCRSCGAWLRWAVTDAGKRMPLDPLPHPEGNVVIVASGSRTYARVLKRGDAPKNRARYRAHFATCPERQKKPAPGPAPRRQTCIRCGAVMDQALTDMGVQTHPMCAGAASSAPRSPRRRSTP